MKQRIHSFNWLYTMIAFLLLFVVGCRVCRTEVFAADTKTAAPALVSAVSTNYNSVTIKWKKVSGATSYWVYYKKTGDQKWTKVKTGLTGTSYTHVSSQAFPLLTGTSYQFTVRSVKKNTAGKYNGKGLKVIPKLKIPSLKMVTFPAYAQQRISWGKVDGANGYIVYRMEEGRWKRLKRVGGNSSCSYTYESSSEFPILDGATYTYTVRAYRKVNRAYVFSSYSKTGIQGTAPAKTDAVFKTGWKTDGTSQYYMKNGKLVSGWKKISGNVYYFDPTTNQLLKNTIAGDSKSGFYYVDDSGIRVTDAVVKQAVAFVLAHTTDAQTNKEKLKTCYDYIVKYYTYERAYDKESIDKMPSYAKYMFTSHKGNCYRGAAALTYIAKVLGYETRMGIGGVTAYAYRDLSPHGWNEVKIDGKWYASDISMQRYHLETNLFLVLRSNYPYRLRVDKEYYLEIKNGKVTWREGK